MKIERGDVLFYKRLDGGGDYHFIVINPKVNKKGWIPVFDLDDLKREKIYPDDLDQYKNLGPIDKLIRKE